MINAECVLIGLSRHSMTIFFPAHLQPFPQGPVVLALADSFELRTLHCDLVSNPVRQREYVFPTLWKRKKASRNTCSRPLTIEVPYPVTDMALEEKLGYSCIYYSRLNLRKHGEVHV